jgi:orotidine-5'-phosphate decarboxylase
MVVRLMQKDSRLIVALDVDTLQQVQQITVELGDLVHCYKVGMQLYYSQGNAVLAYLKEHNKDIFLDLKLHDIPNTVAKSAAVLARLGVNLLTVHALGGTSMLQTVCSAVRDETARLGIAAPKILAVTILTSMDQNELNQIGCASAVDQQVLKLAALAQAAGVDGVVASPKEALQISTLCGPDFLIVTPGIRPAGADLNDQSRVASPAQALTDGATHLVVGRPVLAAANRRLAAQQIWDEMRSVK